ncbi:CoA-binding protein [Aliigemmobacter aestuarii]|uniref:CoA-binding protein n=1 Tax=Aliigemmobacter aestuarii TaxID=1445661 RepID=A0A4S3MQ03_9RHOB|nr:CoA-binding protein [Gemmobacter aestuarii]THD84528.1 CoA-binding protein [Gemmobacter aestuarii]
MSHAASSPASGVETTDETLRRILRDSRVIALVGWSPIPDRPSHRVARFLAGRGYRVIPVNPGQAGQDSGLGEPVRASLAEIGEAVDMVDIFRRSEEVGAVVDEALARLPGLKTIWMQLGVIDDAAAARARAAGVTVVMDRCPAIEIPRLGL